ncbi:MAG: serine hydrolase [Gammaproteobacteria bacterium]|jgi:CubicO group peptidase (beta-lactamase class C family)|nr:serine hydrolase [Gammaproteobacteria bacterium]
MSNTLAIEMALLRSPRRRLLRSLCLFVTLLSPVAGSFATDDGRCTPLEFTAGSSAALHTRMDAALPRLMERFEVPGAALALIEQGRVRYLRGFGMAQPGANVPVTPSTLFQAASDSKPVTAFAVLQLAERRRVDLDDPIEIDLEGWRLPPSRWDSAEVTVRRVLSHTAGLSIPGYGGFPPGQPTQTLLESLAGAADAGGQPVAIVHPPGQGFVYSGGGFTLAQLMLRRQGGEPFAELASGRVLQPLDMANSSFPARPAPSPPLAWTFDDDGKRAPARRFTALAAAGLQTTAGDLARFTAALMPGPCGEPPGRSVISPKSVQAMLTPQPNSANALVLPDSRYGLGIALKTLPSGHLLAHHPGDNLPNWHNLIAAIPERRLGLALMTNAAGGRQMRVAVLCRWLDAIGEAAPPGCPASDP